MIPGGLSRRAQSALAYTDRRIESGERRGDGVEVGAVAKALKVDPIELFTRFVLDEKQWKAFMAALDRPPKDKPRLRRLFTESHIAKRRP